METLRLGREARALRSHSRFKSKEDVREYVIDLLVDVCEESDLCLSSLVAQPLGRICSALLESEPFLFDCDASVGSSLRAEANHRTSLRRVIRALSREDYYLSKWREAVKAVFVSICHALPVEALSDPFPDGSAEDIPALHSSLPLYAMIDDLPHVLTSIIGTFCAPDLQEDELFGAFGESVERRLCLASGISWHERLSSKRRVMLPIDRKELESGELAALYTESTLWAGFFDIQIPIPIPREVRFEHTHIVGGTGHGKTQLLQYLIADDLHHALDHTLSLVILDPDGTLIRTISHTDYFDLALLGDRVIIIDPSESDRPVGLNLFDVSHLHSADTRTKETIENNTIELFEYFFDALLGSELTGKQTTLFRYLGLLLMQIPGGNIHTLRELMEDGRKFRPYMEKLGGSARIFFETRFFAPDLKATKTQVLSRLWAVLSNRSLDRVFSAERNTLNLDRALEDGTIIFVHTSKEYLGEEGSAIFARMIVALLGQSLIRRAALAPQLRTPTYIYLDEAEGVVDDTLVRLLAQCRKYRGALTIAHQHLDQLPSSARAGVMANTSIKLVGGVSAKDASALAPELRTKADFLLSMRKDKHVSRFALFAKNITETASVFSVPLGYAERMDRIGEDDYLELVEWSRQRYGSGVPLPADEPESGGNVPPVLAIPPLAELPVPALQPQLEIPTFRKEGGGGVRHQEIAGMVKELGEAAGFRATLEETILDGEGRVDVILRRDDMTLCSEVSVTTTKEHELLNVRKCLRFGMGRVLVVASLPRHRLSLERYISANLPESERTLVDYLLPDDLADYFAAFVPAGGREEKVVRGYAVKSNQLKIQSDLPSRVFLKKLLSK